VSHGGDLDNRLKTLLDALRIPHEESEIAGVSPDTPNQRVYCLLEDDALITRIAVTTQQLFESVGKDETESTVELLIHIWVQSTYPMWANLGFQKESLPIVFGSTVRSTSICRQSIAFSATRNVAQPATAH
jgi:hypothetical protein